MSIGEDWKRRLQKAVALKDRLSDAERAARAEGRARKMIAELRQSLAGTKEHRCLVMALDANESSVSFDKLRNRQHTSSELFLGAAKTVVDYCLQNGLDVYVWEEDFSMSRGEMGAEIWVTPRGVPYHTPKS